MHIEPMSISIDEDLLADLRSRIRATRWPDAAPGEAWRQGTDSAYLKGLLDYWAGQFDWRAQERRLNEFHHFRADVDGSLVHFVHERARGRGGVPLILTHGWPSSFAEFLPLVPLLTDPQGHGIDGPAFDVVIPSLPGYGFSERPARTGVTTRSTARRWHALMRGLGYERYGAQGADFGAGVTTYMALDHPEPMLGIHLSTAEVPPYTGPGSRQVSPDFLLTVITLYWVTQTITSSMRDYVDNRWSGVPIGPDDFVTVPTAVANFANHFVAEGEPPREWFARLYNVRQWTPMRRGGHFAAAEEPELLARDIAMFFANRPNGG